jgi:hypothetical protein
MEKLEPPILESITAFLYHLIGEETLWISRIITSAFWLVGAVFLYDLGRSISSPGAAIIGVCYFLFLPFSIRASRSFQPDPAMVMLILLTAWSALFLYQNRSWKWILITGLFGGLTGLVKPMGLFFVGGIVTGTILFHLLNDPNQQAAGKKTKYQPLLNSQLWILVIMIVLPFFVYFISGIQDEQSVNLGRWTVLSRWRDIIDPAFFIRWMSQVDTITDLVMAFAGFMGIFFTRGINRALIIGYWAGYFLFGLTFPYHIITHDYYHLPLVGLVALSSMPLIDVINRKVFEQAIVFRITYVLVLFTIISYNGWIGRSILLGNDYRDHPQFWQDVGDSFPEGSAAIGVTQDYGFRLIYYGWRKIDIWPQSAGIEDFDRITAGKDFFVITAKNQLSIDLANHLETNYEVHSQGMGYQIYSLSSE